MTRLTLMLEEQQSLGSQLLLLLRRNLLLLLLMLSPADDNAKTMASDCDVTMQLTSTAASPLLPTLATCPPPAREPLVIASRPTAGVVLLTLLLASCPSAARLTSARVTSLLVTSKLASSFRPAPRSSSSWNGETDVS